MTARISTSPKSAIFSLSGSPIGFSLRAMIASGWMPIERSWLTECCVGLLLNSSLALDVRNQRQVHVADVVASTSFFILPDRLEEGQ